MTLDAPVLAVVGAQYGSEGKGAVAYHLRDRYDVHVRTGGANAGHTFIHEGRKWAMQSVPCGWTNPRATLVIGPGAVISPFQLLREIESIESAGYQIRERLVIDQRAVLVSMLMEKAEGGNNGYAHQTIGSTGKGVGVARMGHMARRVSGVTLLDRYTEHADALQQVDSLEGCIFTDTTKLLAHARQLGQRILLEGTQGHGLSLHLGPWPYVTSANCGTAQMLSDAGLPPIGVETLLVARAHPIRVAGYSGPLPNETTWQELGLDPEITTVTKKVRRVAHWDSAVVVDAIRVNGAAGLAFMFMDYLHPECAGVTDWEALPPQAQYVVAELESMLGVQVNMVGTGPDSIAERS